MESDRKCILRAVDNRFRGEIVGKNELKAMAWIVQSLKSVKLLFGFFSSSQEEH